ncbi:MAG: hypothetical protein GY941_10435 [Planctomycetes bacterium]|nr:hypothetical protein [Planctomycetota bacterium]
MFRLHGAKEVLRRIAERGLHMAQVGQKEEDSKYIDIFQHLLDEIERLPE